MYMCHVNVLLICDFASLRMMMFRVVVVVVTSRVMTDLLNV